MTEPAIVPGNPERGSLVEGPGGVDAMAVVLTDGLGHPLKSTPNTDGTATLNIAATGGGGGLPNSTLHFPGITRTVPMQLLTAPGTAPTHVVGQGISTSGSFTYVGTVQSGVVTTGLLVFALPGVETAFLFYQTGALTPFLIASEHTTPPSFKIGESGAVLKFSGGIITINTVPLIATGLSNHLIFTVTGTTPNVRRWTNTTGHIVFANVNYRMPKVGTMPWRIFIALTTSHTFQALTVMSPATPPFGIQTVNRTLQLPVPPGKTLWVTSNNVTFTTAPQSFYQAIS